MMDVTYNRELIERAHKSHILETTQHHTSSRQSSICATTFRMKTLLDSVQSEYTENSKCSEDLSHLSKPSSLRSWEAVEIYPNQADRHAQRSTLDDESTHIQPNTSTCSWPLIQAAKSIREDLNFEPSTYHERNSTFKDETQLRSRIIEWQNHNSTEPYLPECNEDLLLTPRRTQSPVSAYTAEQDSPVDLSQSYQLLTPSSGRYRDILGDDDLYEIPSVQFYAEEGASRSSRKRRRCHLTEEDLEMTGTLQNDGHHKRRNRQQCCVDCKNVASVCQTCQTITSTGSDVQNSCIQAGRHKVLSINDDYLSVLEAQEQERLKQKNFLRGVF